MTVGPAPANALPVAQFAFSPLAPVVGETVRFESFSLDPGGSVALQEWDLGNDGSIDGTGSPFETASLPQGTHEVTLKVTDNEGEWRR